MLLRRGKRILQTEGLIPLVRRVFPFVARRFFRYENYYLYEYAISDIHTLNEADFMPKVDNLTFKIVSTNQEADELEAEGLEFRSHSANYRDRLDKGAIAFCVFVERELASVSWIAMTEEAKLSLDEPPYKVGFSAGEVCEGGVLTYPKYRRKGLSTYLDFNIFNFLEERGKAVSRGAIVRGNIAAQRAYALLRPKVYAEARYLKILSWKFWKEKPLTQAL